MGVVSEFGEGGEGGLMVCSLGIESAGSTALMSQNQTETKRCERIFWRWGGGGG